jgi:hypothetical protein
MDTNTQNPPEKELLDELLDKLLKNYKKPEDILGEQGLLKRLSKAILERGLGAELTEHLGYEKHDPILAAEIGAKIAAGDWESLGLDEAEAKELFRQYLL